MKTTMAKIVATAVENTAKTSVKPASLFWMYQAKIPKNLRRDKNV